MSGRVAVEFGKRANGDLYRRDIRIVPRDERVKTAEDYQRDHEIALLKLIGPKYPHIIRELVELAVK